MFTQLSSLQKHFDLRKKQPQVVFYKKGFIKISGMKCTEILEFTLSPKVQVVEVVARLYSTYFLKIFRKILRRRLLNP